MGVHGRRFGKPRRLPLYYASTAAGIVAIQGILAALIGRYRGVATRKVATSAAHAGLITVGQYLAAATGDESEDSPGAGEAPPFCSRDGVWFELEALDAGPWQNFWRRIGADERAMRRGWRPFLLRYARAIAPLPVELHAATRSVDFDTVREAAQASGAGLCAVRERPRDMAPTLPWRLEPSPGSTAELSEAPETRNNGTLPLSGLTIVESTRRVQGPLATHLLSELGAAVVRIEPPGGDPLRGAPPMAGDCSARFLALNRHKHVVEVDLKRPAGRREVLDLVSDADGFLHNWAPGKAESFQLDPARLHDINPHLVCAYASGWNEDAGPTPPPGTDFMVQAHAGLSAALGRPGRPITSLMTLLDVLGGLIAAEGLLAGLLAAQVHGRGQRVETSLQSAANELALPHITRRRGPARQPCGETPALFLDEPVRCRDGWLAGSTTKATYRERACRVFGIPPGATAETAAQAVTEACASAPADELSVALKAAGVPAEPVCTDVSRLADHPGIATAIKRDRCHFVASPWRFNS